MNLSNEKNTLLNSVSRFAVDMTASAPMKFVTRGAMVAVALSAVTYITGYSGDAAAACSPATAAADNTNVTCGTNTAGSFDADGFDENVIVVGGSLTEIGVAGGGTGVGIDLTAGADGNANQNVVIVLEDFSGLFAGPGQVTSSQSDAIAIVGDSNVIFNGGAKGDGKSDPLIGGGIISTTGNSNDDNAIDVTGNNNKIVNQSDGTDTAGTGVISSGTGDAILINGTGNSVTNGSQTSPTRTGTIQGDESGINLKGGTAGSGANVVDNFGGSIKGATGIFADDFATIGNAKGATIEGTNGDGIAAGGADTVTINNAGDIKGSDDGISIDDVGTTVTLNGKGTLTGADDGVSFEDDGQTLNFGGGQVIDAVDDGIDVGNSGDADNATLNLGEGTILAGDDGIVVGTDDTGTEINIDGTIIGKTDDRVGGDGIDANESIDLNFNSGQINASDWGIEINDDDADGSNINIGNGTGDTATVDGNTGGILVSGGGLGTDNTDINVKSDGVVQSTNGPGIQINEADQFGDSNDIVVDGKVISTNGTAIIVNGQNVFAGGNDVTINKGGEVSGGNIGVYFDGNGDGTDADGDDLANAGKITGGNIGVLVQNHNSDIGNAGGTIESGDVGVQFDTLHIDGDASESGYQDDETSVINADGDGIRYTTGVNGGSGLEGGAQEVLTVNGAINAGDDGIEVNSKFDVTNNGVITITGEDSDNNGIELNGSDNNVTNTGTIDTETNQAGDGIHAEVDNQLLISNSGTINAYGDGIEVQNGNVLDYFAQGGAEQRVENVGNGVINAWDHGISAGNFTYVYNGENATINGDSNEGGFGSGIIVNNQNTVVNDGLITGANGIEANSLNGSGFGGITNNGTITATNAGILIHGSQNQVTNTADGVITGGEGGGIQLDGSLNIVTNDGSVIGGEGAGLQINNASLNIVTSNGSISSTAGSGGDGIQINGGTNNVINANTVQGDDDGIELNTSINNTITANSVVGTNGHGVSANGSSNNSIIVGEDGISGADDGVNLTNSTNNTVIAGVGGITGTNGDGVDISGGGNNTVTTTGAIIGDPGVVITNSSNNNVTGANIAGTNGGVVINNGNNNTVTTTVGNIDGDSDGNSTGDGVSITGSSNVVGSATDIFGADAVTITGNQNEVTAGSNIEGDWDGVQISGNSNIVDAGAAITGNAGEGVQIDGKNNNVNADNGIYGDDDAVQISGTGNIVTSGDVINSTTGDGVDIDGNSNIVEATNFINGEDAGATISGNTNSVTAGGIVGSTGVYIDGNNNQIDSGVITGTVYEGLEIDGNSNIVDASSVSGGDNAINIDGNSNSVTVDGAVTADTGLGGYGSGILIDGNSNNVSTGDVSVSGSGEWGVSVNGSSNTVETGSIAGFSEAGVEVSGSSNTVNADGDISSVEGNGANVSGSNNTVTSTNNISGVDGVVISGNTNTVSADNNIEGDDDGLIVTGNGNTIDVGNNIDGTDGDGANISGNNNELTVGDSILGDDVGLALSGDDNDVTVADDIEATDGDGVNISGDGNDVSIGDQVTAEDNGIVITGDQNEVEVARINADGGNGLWISGDQNNVTVDESIDASGDGVRIEGGSLNTVDLTGVAITAGNDGIYLGNSKNEVETDDETTIDAGDDGIELNYSGTKNVTEEFTWNGTINADDDGILANLGYMSIINNGTINADADENNDGTGIVVGSNSSVENNGTITGWNGIEGGDKNIVTNSGGALIDVENNGIVVGNENTVANDGTINAGNDGIVAGNNNVITNTSSLTIVADDDGIVVGDGNTVTNTGIIVADADTNGDGTGIVGSDGNTIVNEGSITGYNGIEVDGLGGANTVTNADGATIDAAFVGIGTNFGNTVTNDGEIEAGAYGISAGEQNTITNNGSIQSDVYGVELVYNNDLTNSDGATITAGSDGVRLADDLNTVTNDGTIDAGDDGIEIVAGANTNTVTNTGDILADDDGIIVFGATNTITNSGTIDAGDEGVALVGDDNNLDNLVGGSITGAENGVSVWGDSNDIDNDGSIVGETEDGVLVVFTADGTTLDNSGSITGYNDGVHVQAFSNGGVYTNSGSITGQNGDGVDINGSSNSLTNTSTGTILGADDGVAISNGSNTVVNAGSITGTSDDGVDVSGDDNVVVNSGSILGNDEGIQLDGDDNTIQNNGDASSIVGTTGDGIDLVGDGNDIYNEGAIIGLWSGIDSTGMGLSVINNGGTITGTNSDGITAGSGTKVSNYSQPIGEDSQGETIWDVGSITGDEDGINAGSGLTLTNGTASTITGTDSDGVEFGGGVNKIENWGTISGAVAGLHESTGGGNTTVINTGLITGSEAAYLYSDSEAGGVVTIVNSGTMEVDPLSNGSLPTPVVDNPATEDVDESVVTLDDLINGEGANPVAAIDTSAGPSDLTTVIVNFGLIDGANKFSDPVEDNEETEEVDESAPSVQTSNRFAILGGAGSELVHNFAPGVINGDVALQGGDDLFVMEIGSQLNGDLDMGTSSNTGFQLVAIADDPDTKDVDESKGGTAAEWVEAEGVDTDVDAVVLMGTGYQDHAGNITEAEVLLVDDMLTVSDFYGDEETSNSAAVLTPALFASVPNMPLPAGTWNLNGQTTVDGTYLWTEIEIDTDGDGVTDDEASEWQISGTVGTVVNNGRLNVGGTILVETVVSVDDPDTADVDEGKSTYAWVNQKDAVLTSPVVDVKSGGILGGHGTIITNPGAAGGNGGVNLTGAVQGGDVTYYVGADDESFYAVNQPDESRGRLIVGTVDVQVLDDEGAPVLDEDDNPTYTKVAVDADGTKYPNVVLPASNSYEVFEGAFDLATDSPRYATLAPGDEIDRIGTLTVYGNVTMDGKVTGTTTYRTPVLDSEGDPVLDENDEPTYTDTKGRNVVTNWGSQFQADLKADGTGDLLNVKKTGTTKAIVGSIIDTTGLGTVDLITQDDKGAPTKGEPDGVNDFDFDDDDKKFDILVAGKGGPDGVPDGVEYKVSTVTDGAVIVDGRLDIRLDGQFADLVDNSQDAMIDDPNGPTGCGDDPDGADSCPQIPNPDYKVPDGIADVDSKGIATPLADFSKDAKVWDIIVAEGGVTGKFDEKGFDGGANDGAVVVRYAVADDPSTEEDETVTEQRVQLLKAYLQYLPDRVRIISIPDFAPKGETLNQVITGEYIDSFTAYGLNEDSLHAIVALVGTASDIPAALDALHPEWYNAFNEVGFTIARGAEQQAYIRTIEAQGLSGGKQNRVVMNVGDNSAVGQSGSDNRATFWLSGSWATSDVESNEGFLQYDYQTLTGYAGFDYLINPNFLIGILGGFGNTDVDFDGRTGEGDVDHWQVGGYLSYFTDTWFFNAGGGMGDMNIESDRDIDFGSSIGSISRVAHAEYDGDVYYFYGKGGYSFDTGNGFKITPEAGLTWAKVKQDAFEETGANEIDLIVDEQSVESLRATAQLRFSKTFRSGNGGGWMPYARVGVAHEFEDDLRPISSRFRAAPGTSFTVFGEVPRETTAIFGVGVTGKVSDAFTLFLDYSGEMGGNYSEHVISGGARISF
ncbi:NosD domain-containing protein [Iodidimonas sp. SYSU 1G8]|uniref:NosD domain-containing protein n=1 Tax=Iodidimonas sp. SYSU 1G8 TaxID=3133967 RepID=UPI0031FE52E0